MSSSSSDEKCFDEKLSYSLSFLENSLSDLRTFTKTPLKEITQQSVSDISDVVSEIRAEIASAERRIKHLHSVDGPAPAKQRRLLQESEASLTRFKGSFRELVLESKLVIDKFRQNILLGTNNDSSSLHSRSKKKGTGNASAMRTAASVTESLKRTGSLLEAEISRSATSYQAFSESSRVLEETRHAYSGIESVMQQSRQLLGGLEWSEILDRIILLIGFFIFSSTVLYVLSKRIYIPIISPFTFIRYVYYFVCYILSGAKSFIISSNNPITSLSPPISDSKTTAVTKLSSTIAPALKTNVCFSSVGSMFSYPTCGLKP